MGIGNRIKEARENLGLTQTELGSLVGVTGSAITNYEKETSHPKEQVIYKLMETLNVDANYLFQDVVKIKAQQNDVTLAEYEMIKKYRFISERSLASKEAIDYVFENEYSRVQSAYNIEGQQTLWDILDFQDIQALSKAVQNPNAGFTDELREMLKNTPFQASWDFEIPDDAFDESFYELPNAAHARTDIEIPEGTDTTDNDIMNADDF